MAKFLHGYFLVILVVGIAARPAKNTDGEREDDSILKDKTKESSNREGRQFIGQFPGQFGGGYYPGQAYPNYGGGLNLANANAFASPAGSNANSFSATGDIYNGFTLSNANSIRTPGINSFLNG